MEEMEKGNSPVGEESIIQRDNQDVIQDTPPEKINIKENKPKVIFEKDTHSYYLNGKKGYSVNGVKNYFKDDFEKGYWQLYKALELCIPNFKEMKNKRFKFPQIMKPPVSWLKELVSFVPDDVFFSAKQNIKDSWKDSETEGTEFHNMMEQKLYEQGYAQNPWDGKNYNVKEYKKQFDNQSIVTDLGDLEDGCYPELLVWTVLDNVAIMGQIDECYIDTIGGVRYCDIIDHKTYKKFSKRKSNKTYYAPFEHLDASKYTDCAVQIGLYQHILERHGYTPRHLAFTHYKNYDPETGKRYDLPYYKEDVNKMLQLFDENHFS